ncbi:MAG: hypothetical protein NC084_09075 [Bacteroides sp.]|nr:hypothetical protein [Roseburia sp.]MCM1462848.1 hypothetical protein [Bacteroides sp.]
MVDLSFLTQKDMEILKSKEKFNEDQLTILHHLILGDKSDEGIMLELGMGRNKYYKIKTNLIAKIIRIAVQG